MFFALDKDGNRVYAEDGIYNDCVCPACRIPVIQKMGEYKRHHFAHKRKQSSCPFEKNGDYKNLSEWHIRMQGYFPKEQREHIFTDIENREKHIADVYIKEANTVLEFQYSPIKKEEFLARTNFHLKEGRKIVWLFDESWKDADENSYNKQYNKNGKLVKERNQKAIGPYKEKSFRWLYRRKPVVEGPPVYQPNYSVCVYTGAEGDLFHRIILLEQDKIILSLHDFTMSDEMNVEEFFVNETYWQEKEPWKSEFEKDDAARPFFHYDSTEKQSQVKQGIIRQVTKKPWLLSVDEYLKAYEEEKLKITEERRLHAQAREKKEREDYMNNLVDYFDDIEKNRKSRDNL